MVLLYATQRLFTPTRALLYPNQDPSHHNKKEREARILLIIKKNEPEDQDLTTATYVYPTGAFLSHFQADGRMQVTMFAG
jgi:hypothetical protein